MQRSRSRELEVEVTIIEVIIIPVTFYKSNFKSEALLPTRHTFTNYSGSHANIHSFIQCSMNTDAKKVDNVAVYIGPVTRKPLLGRNDIAPLGGLK